MQLKKLTLKQRPLFNKFLGLKTHELSVYAFENIFIWSELFEIYWSIIRSQLCVFFQDKCGAFLYLPPLGSKQDERVIGDVFTAMERINQNKEVCRIENIEEKDKDFFESLGLTCRRKSHDYLYRRYELASLSGNRLKHKRASANYFHKHYPYEYLPFQARDAEGCLRLYQQWEEERASHNQDSLYRGMLKDNFQCLQTLLANHRHLGLTGRIIKSESEIKGFTFGFKLNPDTACILYEVTDLSLKGVAQFMFQRFCQELKDYKYINAMDDSGLENLKKVKLSYRPHKLAPAYIARKK